MTRKLERSGRVLARWCPLRWTLNHTTRHPRTVDAPAQRYLGNFVVARAAKRKIVEDSRFVLRHEGNSVVAMVS